VLEVVVVVGPGVPVVNSTWRRGAPADVPSNDSAVRVPVVPVMISAIGRPLTHPPTLMMSWMIAAMFGLRCATPAAPTVVHPGMLHATGRAVRGRLEMLLSVSAKVRALLLA
jgi:hypothetical protein